MKKKVLIVALILLVSIFLGSCISLTFALTEFYEHISVMGITVIDIPGVTPENGIQFTFHHFDRTSDHGVRDNIRIQMWTYMPASGTYQYFPVAFYTDTSEGIDFYETIVQTVPIQQLKRWQLNVFRFRNTAIGCWTVPLEIPETTYFEDTPNEFTTPALTIPPGCLIIKGYGEPIFETRTATFGKGFTAELEIESYEANGCFICPKWRFWGSTTGYTTVLQQSMQFTGP
jgi:hypothetical protein